MKTIMIVLIIIVILMLFVFPFFIPNEYGNNKTFTIIYFTLFFLFQSICGFMKSKLESKDKEEERQHKIQELFE